MSDVGFVGLGAMGTPMARRLLDAGHAVHAWNRTASAADELVESGAIRVNDVRDAVSTGLVFSMLASDEAFSKVFTDDVLRSAPPGTIHVNHATLSVTAAEHFAASHEKFGVAYIAAPVLGRSTVVLEGKLNIVAAGPRDTLAQVQPFLDILGKRTWIVGESPQAANVVKIAVNYNLLHALQALAESLTLVECAGVDGQSFVDILTDSAFTGTAYAGYGPIIAHKRYSPPGFALPLGLKDLTLAESAAAAEGVVLPVAPVLRQMFEKALADPELADLDWSAVAEITRRMAAPPR
jgi:3-hydroxyisobutyrate dehydrogenase-like beta-hydroxyacid dehydrogenase